MQKKIMKTSDNVLVLVIYFIVYVFASTKIIEFVYSVSPFMILNFLVQIAINVLVFASICMLCRKLLIDGMNKISPRIFTKAFKYYCIMFFVNIFVNIPIVMIMGEQNSNNQQGIDSLIQNVPLYATFSIIVFAPIIEELVFRGVIYKVTRQKLGVVAGVLASSMSFALMHFIITFRVGDLMDIVFLPVYVVPAIFLCLIYEKTNNILAPITLHFINNFISLFITFVGMLL